MFPRKGFLVDEATILVDGEAKSLQGGAKAQGLNVAAYFSADAVGSVAINDQDGALVATLTAPTGGGKVITSRNEFESYSLESVTLDETNLSAGSVQVSLY